MRTARRRSTLLIASLLLSDTLLAQSTTITFDNPVPSGAPDSYLNGTYQGIEFGASQWRWSGPYSSDPTRSIYFATSSSVSRSFSFVGGARVLTNLTVYTTKNGTMTLSDGVNANVTRTVTTGAMMPIETGWTQASTTVTVAFTSGWSLGIDDIVHRAPISAPDAVPPSVSMVSPSQGATITGLVNLSADATDDVGVAGVQFLVDGTANGTEDTTAPFTGSWNSTAANNGPHSIAARARDWAGNVTTSPAVTATVSNSAPVSGGYALRFYGNGRGDIDRVKIVVDDPYTTAPGTPVDVGASDFTLEFWMRGSRADNGAAAVSCGHNNSWIYGNIVVDRDRFDQGRSFGISLGAGRVAFGVDGTSGSITICGTTDVLDGQWHHVAVQRRRSDGWVSLYVDGVREANADGPNGDVSYPDDGVPLYRCGTNGTQQCTYSDPFLVVGAEKHDAGSRYPSFNGFFDELRISKILRYGSSYSRPSGPFGADANTVGLYHFDEGQGFTANDTSGATGGPTNGVLRYGGSPAGPLWSTESPFSGN